MEIARIRIANFRNFSELDVPVAGNVVVAGENRVGKSNLLHALRLVLDPGLADKQRQLTLADFWDGAQRTPDIKISISIEIVKFENDPDVLAVLTDYRIQATRTPFGFRMSSDPKRVSEENRQATVTTNSFAMAAKMIRNNLVTMFGGE
jgi:putative ATP-dependent endonuclease of the OLD family